MEGKGTVVSGLHASKGRRPSFYLLLVFFSLTAGIVVASAVLFLGAGAVLGYLWWRQGARFFRDRHQVTEALREGESRRVAYAIQDGRGSRAT